MFYSLDPTSLVVETILAEVATLHIRVDVLSSDDILLFYMVVKIMDVKCFIVHTLQVLL